MPRRIVVTAAGVLLAASAAWAAEGVAAHRGDPGVVVYGEAQPAVPSRPDADIARDVSRAVLGYVNYGVFDSVEVSVERGRVVLAGSVAGGHRRGDIERRVARVPGVREVRNLIRVQPGSVFDDRLRWQLFRRIYGENGITPVASMVNPPVRIVVENGRVTLTGVVGSAVERALVGMAARQTLAFRVDNLVEVESELRRREVPTRAMEQS